MFSAFRSNADYRGKKENVQNHCVKEHLEDGWEKNIQVSLRRV
jgi:hypothetical protein